MSKGQESHFTALIEVIEVTPSHFIEAGYNSEKINVPRDTEEVAKVVVRASTLEELSAKVIQHMQVIAPEQLKTATAGAVDKPREVKGRG